LAVLNCDFFSEGQFFQEEKIDLLEKTGKQSKQQQQQPQLLLLLLLQEQKKILFHFSVMLVSL